MSVRVQRRTVRTAFTRALNELTDELEKDGGGDRDAVEKLFKCLQSRREKLMDLDQKVEEELLADDATSEDMFAKEYENVTRYGDQFLGTETDVEKRLGAVKEESETAGSGAMSKVEKTKYRLPKLEWKRFSGDPKDWLGFWSQFMSVHEDETMSPQDKFQYLLQGTLENSKAREVVESFPATAENYPKVIAYLKSRFGKDDMLVEVYVRDLLRLVLHRGKDTSISQLYDRLETQLRALETLGVTSEKYAAMLFPLVESSLSEETLRAWERSRTLEQVENEDRLKNLMNFLRVEVESESRISLARRGFMTEGKSQSSQRGRERRLESESVPTANDLYSNSQNERMNCLFCGKSNHKSSSCFAAKKMPFKLKLAKVRESNACMRCLRTGHFQRDCKWKQPCSLCSQGHNTIMCPGSDRGEECSGGASGVAGSSASGGSNGASLANYCSSGVLLQTLIVRLRNGKSEKNVRALIDTGSTHSYISKKAVEVLGFRSKKEVKLAHCLFGGVQTRETVHHEFMIKVAGMCNDFETSFCVLDQQKICGSVSHVPEGPWLEQLRQANIQLTDVGPEQREIHILIGADVAGTLFTGDIFHTASGPVAMRTTLGWTLMGKCVNENGSESALIATSLHVSSLDVQDLWRLDLIGITDDVETKSKEDLMNSALEHFKKTVKLNDEGRYEINLPWIDGHPPVSVNRNVAERRMKSAYQKLEAKGGVKDYTTIFTEWEEMGVVERVEKPVDFERVSYLPHRPVFKPNSTTTPIRPVFDASARSGGLPSLNDCLEKGPNLIELLPDILLRFRDKRYGILSDIKKAFLMISVREEDRDFLRFLWIDDGKLQEYRHCRVVFGVTSSPFLLAATINYHLENCDQDDRRVAAELKKSLYVDNSVVSFDTTEEMEEFKIKATALLASAKMELRGWAWSHNCLNAQGAKENAVEPVLGLLWNTETDTLCFDLRSTFSSVLGGSVDDPVESSEIGLLSSSGCGLEDGRGQRERVTKKIILSAVHKIFDPLGVVCAVTLVPKKLLQDLWKLKLNWDDEVSEETRKKFLSWFKDLRRLHELRIPRWTSMALGGEKTLHVFTDASKSAYSACVFLRQELCGNVGVQLVMAKAKVAPTKQMTIPRLELMGCGIGARLASKVVKVLGVDCIRVVYWTDSANALYWIQRGENWAIFVWNRVQEIRKLSEPEAWRHITGELNPADLPSRGCSVSQLLELHWWEGPSWLRLPEKEWPCSSVQCNLQEVWEERKKCVVSQVAVMTETRWYLRRFSSYRKIIRVVAWMMRVRCSLKKNKNQKTVGDLTVDEEKAAEIVVLRMVQQEVFDENHPSVIQLQAKLDMDGLWRVRSRIVMREDSEDFRFPILLSPDHPLTWLLAKKEHLQRSHCGNQVLQCVLRERFWVPKSRKLVRSVIYSCGRCRRHVSKRIETVEAPLPENRVKDAAVFEVTGVDLGGPLYLKNKSKVWFVVYTCGVYRAVHLELVSSLTTEGFLQSLRRFIARRGRPSVMYSDNGTNFQGSQNDMKKLDWVEIEKETATHQIKWIFNPPSAPWWGGWWERIVGMVKTLLRRVLGKACLDFEELMTVMCDVEQVINSRPLTYISDNPEDCIPLTPNLFLGDLKTHSVVDLDEIDGVALNKRLKYRMQLREDLRRRFRDEYLALLVHQKKTKKTRTIAVGEVVLIGDDNRKRIEWRLARVMEMFQGRDGVERVARLRTAVGEVTRPVQRLYPLELTIGEDPLVVKVKSDEGVVEHVDSGELRTRSGRVVKLPLRFMQ